MGRTKQSVRAELMALRMHSGVYAPECICSATLVNSVIRAILQNVRHLRKTKAREYVIHLLHRFVVPAGVVRLGGAKEIPVELYYKWLLNRTKQIVLSECLNGTFPRGVSRKKVIKIMEEMI